MIAAPILLPLILAGLAFVTPSRRLREVWLLGAALGHAAIVALLAVDRPTPSAHAWLGLDDLGLLVLAIVSLLFAGAAVYSVGYLRREPLEPHTDNEEGELFSNEPEAVFVGCFLLFLSTMSLVTLSRHMGLLWVGVEATTLASAPLIYFHRHHRSLEATWKYLLVCSVGIGFALLGNVALVASAAGHESTALDLEGMIKIAPQLNRDWLQASFLLFLVGYGTKMGLAPMHTWLPDAHSESPSPVSALLSGALLNCAFLGILRAYQILDAAGMSELARGPLRAFGLFSMAVGAFFIVRQTDFKRMLAYSSVEHMGVIAFGVGIGGAAIFGSMLHALSHSLAKATLFLVAGNILARYGTKHAEDVRGAVETQQKTAVLWVAGLFAITGMPPFALFLSEFTIVRAAITFQPWLAVLFLILLAVAFIAMMAVGLPMTLGRAPKDISRSSEPASSIWPPIAFITLLLVLGLYIPAPIRELLEGAAGLIGGP